MKETKFKQTEVGMIPSDWEAKTLGSISFVTKLAGFEFTSHVRYSDDGKIIALRGLNVRKGQLLLDDVKYIDNSNFSKLNRSKLFKKDLLFTYVGTVGNAALVDKNNTYYLAPNVALIRIDEKNSPEYLMHLILSDYFFNNQIKTLMSTTSQAALSMTNIRLFLISLPPTIEEQQRIANALSDVDTLIANLEKLIAKKKNIKQGAMQQLLTGRKRLPGFGSDERREMKKGNRHCEERSDAAIQSGYKMTELGMIPSDWENTSLNKVVEFLNGDRGFNYPKDSDFCDLGIPFINAGHLKKSQIDFTSMDYITESHYKKLGGAKIKKDDILFCLRGSLGKYAYVNFNDAAPASSLCVLRSKRICPKFLFQILGSDYIKKQIVDANSGSSQPNLSAKDVGLFNIIMPSTIDEQSAIANILSDMDTEIATLETKLAKYRKLKTGMMQQLLTGKIRLIK